MLWGVFPWLFFWAWMIYWWCFLTQEPKCKGNNIFINLTCFSQELQYKEITYFFNLTCCPGQLAASLVSTGSPGEHLIPLIIKARQRPSLKKETEISCQMLVLGGVVLGSILLCFIITLPSTCFWINPYSWILLPDNSQHPIAAAPGQHTQPAAKNSLLSQQAGEHQPRSQLCQDTRAHTGSQPGFNVKGSIHGPDGLDLFLQCKCLAETDCRGAAKCDGRVALNQELGMKRMCLMQ